MSIVVVDDTIFNVILFCHVKFVSCLLNTIIKGQLPVNFLSVLDDSSRVVYRSECNFLLGCKCKCNTTNVAMLVFIK